MSLKNVLDFAQVAQPMLAKIDELEGQLRRRDVPHELPGGFSQENLATGAGSQEPGETIERGGEVVTVVRCCGAGVQRHAHPDRPDGTPIFGDQGRWAAIAAIHSIERRGKGSLNGVAY